VNVLRAGIVVTGTEVLSGIISDRNGPWLSERLRERGVQLAHIDVVGDRPEDLRAALEFLAARGLDVVITSGGLGPTADDLTIEVVADFCGRALVLDTALEERIWAIVARLRGRFLHADESAMRTGARKQAYVPEGATVLEPVGTAPGLVVPPADGVGPTVVVLPGPPGELQAMWRAALETPELRRALAGAGDLEQRIVRMFGIPESEIAETLRVLEGRGVPLDRLEVTTCLRRGEIEIATVFGLDAADAYAQLEDGLRARHADTIFSTDGATIDEIVAGRLAGRTIAVAESCTGGLMAGRLTDRAGSSAYVLGGAVVYSNAAKVALAGVPAELIERHGAVSPEVARALADGARERFGAQIGVGITGIAGPGGAVPGKPVGTVCLSVAAGSPVGRASGESDPPEPGARRPVDSQPADRIDRTVHLPGGRADVRERTTTVVMHLLRQLLDG
jgi:competence/damage-inducible protein CinA-like protein